MYWSLKFQDLKRWVTIVQAEGIDNAEAGLLRNTRALVEKWEESSMGWMMGSEQWFRVRWGRAFYKKLRLYPLGSRNQ